MQDYNQYRKCRSLRGYYKDEGIDEYKKNYLGKRQD
jgi:hypothetical protein